MPVSPHGRVKMPTLRRPPAMPRGPRLFTVAPQIIAGPGQPPPGFIMPTNSNTEWPPYWGLCKIFQNPIDPRQGPPFMGGWPDWTYQKAVDGGRKEPGGAVLDFVVYKTGPRGRPCGIRIVTDYFHLYTSAEKQEIDEIQKEKVSQYADVVDVYDFTYMDDPTGQAIIKQLKAALGLIEYENVLEAGTARRAR